MILADQAEKAIAQMRHEVRELLADRYPREKAEEIAKLMTSGTWTHDYPITCDRAHALGLPVRSKIPENVLRLMELYPQPMRRQPSVEYVPVPYRSDRQPGAEVMTWTAARQGATACKAHIRPRLLFKCRSTTIAGLTASQKRMRPPIKDITLEFREK